MKNKSPVKTIIIILVLVTVVAACIHLSTRTSVPEGTLQIEYNGQKSQIAVNDLDPVHVSGTVPTGKGEERVIDADGVLLSDVLEKAGITEFSGVTVTADDSYSADVTCQEINEQDKVFLILQDDGGVRLIVFGDENSKRRVSDVVLLSVY